MASVLARAGSGDGGQRVFGPRPMGREQLLGVAAKRANERVAAANDELRGREHVKIADLREGEKVVLRGRVGATRPGLRAPITGEQCVAFHLDVISARRDRWGPIELHERTHGTSFELDDGSGCIVVRGDQLVLAVEGEATWHECADVAAIEAVVESTFQGLPMVVHESVVRAGDELVVSGTVSFDRSEGLYRDGAPTPSLVASADAGISATLVSRFALPTNSQRPSSA